MGRGSDVNVDVNDDEPEDDDTSADIPRHVQIEQCLDTEGYHRVWYLSRALFRDCLVTHFDIAVAKNELQWPA